MSIAKQIPKMPGIWLESQYRFYVFCQFPISKESSGIAV
ncbi:hypothetical protein CKA32_002924 [Geitlerinema sp. FC II]|nr:hypothetical protein CKA32_002924 [Geitlerinema sp. FC II]